MGYLTPLHGQAIAGVFSASPGIVEWSFSYIPKVAAGWTARWYFVGLMNIYEIGKVTGTCI